MLEQYIDVTFVIVVYGKIFWHTVAFSFYFLD